MATLEDTTMALITELKRIQAAGSIPEGNGNGYSIPGQIAVGDGRFILTSREMDRLIGIVAREFKRNDALLARTHTDREWNWTVRGAFGPALATIDLDGDLSKNAESVLDTVRVLLTPTKQGSYVCEHAFGCTLFGKFDISPFEIGPVRFEPRLEWLNRKTTEGDVRTTIARRVARNWTGARQRKLKSPKDAMRERDILDVVGDCPYVCSVETVELAPEAGRLKAQTAARLAMTTIALCWHLSSRALSGFNLLIDHGVGLQRSLSFTPGNIPFASGTRQGMPHGPGITAADWAAVLSRHRADFDVAGEAITYFLSPAGGVSRPTLMNALSQALLWFHEGCREQVALIAVVKFSASLDALAVGEKARGIRRLVTARLGIREDQEIYKGGPSMRAAINEIYGEGRSLTIHGISKKFSHDWSSTKELGEQFARLCLITALGWSAKHPALDDPSLLQR